MNGFRRPGANYRELMLMAVGNYEYMMVTRAYGMRRELHG
jgi:hypothetical protein